jgi:hypothetical protein
VVKRAPDNDAKADPCKDPQARVAALARKLASDDCDVDFINTSTRYRRASTLRTVARPNLSRPLAGEEAVIIGLHDRDTTGKACVHCSAAT